VLIYSSLHTSRLGCTLRAALKRDLLVDAALYDRRWAVRKFAICQNAVSELADLEESIMGAHVELYLRAVVLAIRLRELATGRFAKRCFWLLVGVASGEAGSGL
jgi:hypothetical protein